MQAENIEIRKKSEIHRVRSCFRNDDAAQIHGHCTYKAVMTGLRFKSPFENCNFADLDNFTLRVAIDNMVYILKGCLWDDFYAAADKRQFREHISVTALIMETEDENAGN